MPFINMNQRQYFYGAALPTHKEPEDIILFVHGAGGNHQYWTYQLQYFGNNHLAMAVDLPGHGQSQGESASDISRYTAFIKEFFERLIGCPFILVGHSMGGAIALDFARRYPERLSGLVLVGTGARLKVLPAILKTFAAGNVFRELLNYLYGKDAPRQLLDMTRKDMEMVSPKVFFNDFSACNNFDMQDSLGHIKTKTLVVAATEDTLAPVKYSEYLHENIPDSKIEIIDQAGHMMMLEQPERFNSLVESFISGI